MFIAWPVLIKLSSFAHAIIVMYGEKDGDIGEVFYFLLLYDYDRNEIRSVGVGKVRNASQIDRTSPLVMTFLQDKRITGTEGT